MQVFLSILTACILTAQADISWASPGSPKILLHLLGTTTKNMCSRSGTTPTCDQVTTSGFTNTPYFAYVLVADADSASGIAGVQFGIEYNPADTSGVDVFEWYSCATLQFPDSNWPDAGSGNLVTWDPTTACQRIQPAGLGTGVMAIVGYFYCAAYSADTMRVTTRPADNCAKVSSCNGQELIVESQDTQPFPSHLGSVVFSQDALATGHNPCGLEPQVTAYVPHRVLMELVPEESSEPGQQSARALGSLQASLDAIGATAAEPLIPDFEQTAVSAWGDTISLPCDMSNWYIVSLADTNVWSAIDLLLADTVNVNAAEPDYYRIAQFRPSDQYCATQWHLNVNSNDRVPAEDRADIDAYTAWDIVENPLLEPQSTRVAIIDTGIDYNHGDLSGVVLGPDYIDEDNVPDDASAVSMSHGTGIAGVIGARLNGLGVVGVDYNATLIAIRAAHVECPRLEDHWL